MSTQHHAVGLIVTNPARSRFYVQQKDADYPDFPRGYSTFGGAREAGETTSEALARELREELGGAAEALIAAGPTEVLTSHVGPRGFAYTLFELEVDDAVLDELARTPVLEGERGAVFERGELLGLPFVWGLEQVVAAYLEARPSPDDERVS